MTIHLREPEIGRFISPLHLLEELRAAKPVTPGAVEPGLRRSGTVEGIPAQTRAVEAHGRWTVELRSLASDELLATMETQRLFAFRDAVVAALSVEKTARPDANVLALLGGGRNAGVLLKSVRLVRSLQKVRVWDENVAQSFELATRLYKELSLPTEPCGTVDEAVANAQIILVASKLDRPFLLPAGVQATFVEEEVQPFHDLVTAWHVHQVAKDDASVDHA